MTRDQITLFNYKGRNIYVCKNKNKYFVGINGGGKIDIWFDSIPYSTLQLAITSGREYARIMIDKIILSEKEKQL